MFRDLRDVGSCKAQPRYPIGGAQISEDFFVWSIT